MNSEVPPNPPNELPRADSKQPPSNSANPDLASASEVAPAPLDEQQLGEQQPSNQQPIDQPPVTQQPVKEPPPRGWHRPLLALVLLGMLGYAVLVPMAIHSMRGESNPKRRMDEMPLSQMIEVHSMKAVAVLWIISLGATVGSFLNVVAYRMPRNKSVVLSASRCPKCNSSIRPTDNVPIFGWLRLEGRCRTCRNPISAQYPIVEALAAAIFLLLFTVELISGGANLPIRTPNLYAGIVWVLFELRWDLILYFLYHCLLFCLVLSWMLIDLDRQKVTRLAVLVSAVLIVAPLLAHPYLLPVPVVLSQDSYPPSLSQVLLSSLFGGVVGLAIGALFASLYSCKPKSEAPSKAPQEASSEAKSPLEVTQAVQTQGEHLGADHSVAESIEVAHLEAAHFEGVSRGELSLGASAEATASQAESPDDTSKLDSSTLSELSKSEVTEVMDHSSIPSARNLVSAMLLIGLSLGWQAVLTVAITALCLRLICYFAMQVANYRLPLSLFLLAGLTLHHAAWRWIFKLFEPCWIGDTFSPIYLIILLVAFAVLLGLNRFSLCPARTAES